jgi:putative transcriptional regulator
MKKNSKVSTFRDQMARSMAELQGIMKRGESPTGNGRLTVRRVEVTEPGTYDAMAVKETREELNVSQSVFAQLLGVSPVLVRSWERGVRTPAPVARRLLDQVREEPSRFLSLVHAA